MFYVRYSAWLDVPCPDPEFSPVPWPLRSQQNRIARTTEAREIFSARPPEVSREVLPLVPVVPDDVEPLIESLGAFVPSFNDAMSHISPPCVSMCSVTGLADSFGVKVEE